MNAAVFGLAVACVAAVAITPMVRRCAMAAAFFDRPGLHKSHGSPVPYLGGLAIAISVLIGVGAAAVAGFSHHPSIVVTLVVATSLAVLGGFDDKHALRADVRLVAQAVAAGAVVLAGTRLTLTGSAPFDVVLTLVWIVAMTNAINFVDNMDGLASGFGAVSGLAIAVIAGSSHPAIAVLAGALSGGCLGFLFWNRPPARIFMGDAGSLFIGFLVAVLSADAASSLGVPRSTAVPFIVLAVPLLDIATVTVGRIRRGIPITTGGRNHLSHRLVARGWGRGRAVLLLVVLAGTVGLIGVGVSKSRVSTFTAVAGTALVLAFITALTVRAEVFHHHSKPRLPRVLLVAMAAVVLVALTFAPAAIALENAHGKVAAAASLTRQAINSRQKGDSATADAKFAEATRLADSARRDLSGSFVSIGLYVPVVRDNLVAARDLTDVVTDLAASDDANTLKSLPVIEAASRRLARSDDATLLPSIGDATTTLRSSVLSLGRSTPTPSEPPASRDGRVLPAAIVVSMMLLLAGFTIVLWDRTPLLVRRSRSDVDVTALSPLLCAPADVLVDAEAGQSTS